ncbi:probable chitinase 2 [Panulirus ornatus]|uniref:probable chitinase 2 n=1 Tax=Panulirus ornatus TaxID=150431 RepID=UPI003A835B8B
MVGCTLTLLALSAFALGGALAQHDQQVACYLGSWAVYRPGAGKFNIEDIDPTLCTTLIYSFAGLNETTNNIKSLDPEYDINKRAYEKFVNLKSLNPRLKVLMAVGGWTEGSKKYSAMASTSETRKIFIDSAVKFIQKHKFDGLDLDWEYPANRGGVPEDKENFVDLVKELRKEFDKYGWMLTAALAAGKSTIETAYDIDELAEELDFIHIMAYDYHGKWDGRTGHNAPLYSREDEPEDEKYLNVDATVKLYLDSGAPPHKLLLGVGLYGRTFLLSDITNPGISSPSLPTAFAGPYTREDGFLGYNEICEKQRTESGDWTVVWQEAHQAPYMYRDNMWVGYDDNFSLSLKVAYAQSLGLGGIMVWSIDTDDFTGTCAKNSIRFPMLRSINQALTMHAVKRPGATPTTTKPVTKKPIEIDIDIDDDDDDIDLDVDNDLDDYKYNIDDSRTSSVGAEDGGGSSAITPALSILLALLMTAAVAR